MLRLQEPLVAGAAQPVAVSVSLSSAGSGACSGGPDSASRFSLSAVEIISGDSSKDSDASRGSKLSEKSVSSSLDCTLHSSHRLVSTASPEAAVAQAATWKLSMDIDGTRSNATVSLFVNAAQQTTVIDVWVDGCIGAQSTHAQFIVPKPVFDEGAALSGSPVVVSPMPGKVRDCFMLIINLYMLMLHVSYYVSPHVFMITLY